MRYAGLTFDMYDPVCAMHGPPRQIVEARSGTRRLPCRLYGGPPPSRRDAEVAELGPAAARDGTGLEGRRSDDGPATPGPGVARAGVGGIPVDFTIYIRSGYSRYNEIQRNEIEKCKK